MCWGVFVNTNRPPVAVLLIFAVFTTAIAVKMCSSLYIFVWLAGQLILAAAVMQWFFLLQTFGRGEEVESNIINLIGGHVASFFCLVPFNQWRYLKSEKFNLGPRGVLIEKKWIPPFNVLIYSMKNYWNLKKLFSLFPQRHVRVQFIMSSLVMNCFFLLLIPNVHHFWRKFGIGYVIFLILIERWFTKKLKVEVPSSSPEL